MTPTQSTGSLTGNQLRLASELGMDTSDMSRDAIPVTRLRVERWQRELEKRGMRVGTEVQRNGRIRTIHQFDFPERVAILSFRNRFKEEQSFKVKIPNLLKHYEVVPPPPAA